MAKKRMPISIRFTLRSLRGGASYGNPHPLEIWITINRKRRHFAPMWPPQTGEHLTVNPQDWLLKKQASRRRDDLINEQIPALKAHIMALFRVQHTVAAPTTESVQFQLAEGRMPVYTPETGWQTSLDTNEVILSRLSGESPFMDAYSFRLAELIRHYGPAPTRVQQIDVGRWQRGFFLLEEWERITKRKVPVCKRITLSWLEDYHAWLQTQQSPRQSKPISAGMASRYIGKIGKVLAYLVKDEQLEQNNVKKQSWPRYNDKEIHFLEPEQVDKLFTLRWKRTKGVALWWFLLMCCTGLDYPDAIVYARNRRSLERIGVSGRKLVGKRLKSPHEDYDVPFLDEVEWLFAIHPTGPRELSGNAVNRYTDQIEDVLNIDWRITKKTARKTFGCLMLINGYYISEVSRMLGHRRISTTEKHYAKLIGTGVDRGRARVGRTSLLSNIVNRAN